MIGKYPTPEFSGVNPHAHERGAMMIGPPQTRPPRILVLIFMLSSSLSLVVVDAMAAYPPRESWPCLGTEARQIDAANAAAADLGPDLHGGLLSMLV